MLLSVLPGSVPETVVVAVSAVRCRVSGRCADVTVVVLAWCLVPPASCRMVPDTRLDSGMSEDDCVGPALPAPLSEPLPVVPGLLLAGDAAFCLLPPAVEAPAATSVVVLRAAAPPPLLLLLLDACWAVLLAPADGAVVEAEGFAAAGAAVPSAVHRSNSCSGMPMGR